jgi:hypothetical protein
MLITNCGSQEATYTVETINGVKHVHNISPKWEIESRISLEYVQKFGELDSEDKNLLFHLPVDVTVDRYGNIFICDGGNHRIQKFDKNGNFILSIGRRGQGPGEINFPQLIHATENDELVVVHGGGRSLFKTNGEFIRNIHVHRSAEILDNSLFVLYVFYSLKGEQKKSFLENPGEYSLYHIINLDGEVVGELGQIDGNVDKWMNTQHAWMATDDSNNYFRGYWKRNLLEKYSQEGKLLFRADRELPFEETSKREFIKWNDREGNFSDLDHQFSFNICIDGKQRIWSETFMRQWTKEERLTTQVARIEDPSLIAYEVYNNQGVLLQRIPWKYGKGRELRHIKGDQVFFRSLIDECIYEYKIVDLK